LSFDKTDRTQLLKEKLDELCLNYDVSHIGSDPIQFPHRYRNPSDIEAAAFIASSLAYGNVASIRRNLERVFSFLGTHPHETLLSINPGELTSALSGFKHRFTTVKHLSLLLLITRVALIEHGSLKNLFLEGHVSDRPSIKESLIYFVDHLLGQDVRPVYRSVQEAHEDGALFLLPSPRNGAACKRLNLFLRWMVRTGDAIDFGLWPEVSRSQLVIPLDTHAARLSRYLGLTKRKTSDWKTAEEITDALRKLDPTDPLKYDFSLTRLGILGDCDSKEGQSRCDECVLAELCSREILVS